MAFRDISGHRRLIGLLGRALRSDSLPPSLIFAGTAGVGKKLTAMALAQAVNCATPLDALDGSRDACGTCASCRRIERLIHPDVTLVTPEDGAAIRVEQIRTVVGQTAYRPYEGFSRVVIVDDADQMGDDAQNALLKTLEEPPPRNVFVLVTSRPDMLLDTIHSRCCVLRFAPLASADVAQVLMSRHGVSETEARATAALAGGTFTRALAAAGGELAEARAVATAVLIEAARARDPRVRLAIGAAMIEGATKKSKSKTRDAAPSGSPDRNVLATRLRAMHAVLRDLALLSDGADSHRLVNPDMRQELDALVADWDRDRIQRAFQSVGRALSAVDANASSKVVADWLAFQL